MGTTELAATATTSIATGAPDGVDIVALWLASFTSANTRSAYERDLTAFKVWMADNGIGPLEANRPVIEAWVRHMVDTEELRPTTISRRLSAVRSFYTYAEDWVPDLSDPTFKVKRPKTGEAHVELTPALTTADAGKLYATAVAHGPTDTVLVLLLLAVGLRVSEALALNLEDVTDVRGHCSIAVTGKGGTVQRITLPPVLCEALDDLEDEQGRTTGPILMGTTGVRMNRSQANRAITRLANRAGLGKVTPHMLRATAVTEALEAGASLRDVQDFARHSSPVTTRRYDRARGQLDRHAATAAQIVARITTSQPEPERDIVDDLAAFMSQG